MIKKLFIFLIFALILNAENISQYNIDIFIEEDGQLYIEEEIIYDFQNQYRHGIYRNIPIYLKLNSVKKDLGFNHFDVKMDNKNVNYSISQNNEINIKIGDKDKVISGKHKYFISYYVKIGVFPDSSNSIKNDITRWNIIGNEWNIPINNIISNIYLPSAINKNNVKTKLYTGESGSKKNNGKLFWLSKDKIHIEIDKLNKHESATVELTYPSGLLGKKGIENFQYSIIEKIISNIYWFIFAILLYYFKYSINKYSTKINSFSRSVQYNIPQDVTLLQSGLILDKSADNKDFLPAIIELAHLGYLKINIPRKGANPIFTKTQKTTTNLSEDQKFLLEQILFKNDDTFKLSKNKKNSTLLTDGFASINKNLYDWAVDNNYMENNILNLRNKYLKQSFFVVLPLIIVLIYSLILTHGVVFIIMSILPSIFTLLGISMILNKKIGYYRILSIAMLAVNFYILYTIMNHINISLISIISGPYVIILIVLYLWGYVYNRLGVYKIKGINLVKHLFGLKEFISRVKQDEIKRRLKEDPLYIEKLLPYAILFGKTEHWLTFYVNLEIENPNWYDGNISNFDSIQHQMSNVANHNSNQSSSSGTTSGGSFSGGGGGGGGGGSW